MKLRFELAWLPGGLATDIALEAGPDGRLAAVGPATGDERSIAGLAVPGLPNLHSHAFQRAMAGAAEARGAGDDSFWGWREAMYGLAARLDAGALIDVAAFAYAEMLEAGYTTVAEFHYLHHEAGGGACEPPAAMANALREAARLAGMRQLLLPTLYQRGGFDGSPPSPAQRRFLHDVPGLLALFESLRARETPLHSTGLALHSLRAVAPGSVAPMAAAARAAGCPLHVHVAEQLREVHDCLAHTGRRPVQWLLESGLIDERWCLVHATHADAAELEALAATGAVVGLCPSTEANLADGQFAIDRWIAAGGAWGVGSDSNVVIDPREELRLLEGQQRLAHGRRAALATPAQPGTATSLWARALAGGARACGLPAHGLVAGAPADFIVLDTHRAELCGLAPEALLDAFVLAPRPGLLRDAWVAGQQVVRDGRHVAREALARRYRSTVTQLRHRS